MPSRHPSPYCGISAFLALLSEAAMQKSRSRGTADVSASCRSHNGGLLTWEAENLRCKRVAPFWDAPSNQCHVLPLVVLLHLSSGCAGELGHRAACLC